MHINTHTSIPFYDQKLGGANVFGSIEDPIGGLFLDGLWSVIQVGSVLGERDSELLLFCTLVFYPLALDPSGETFSAGCISHMIPSVLCRVSCASVPFLVIQTPKNHLMSHV